MPFYAISCALTDEILVIVEGAPGEDPGSVERWCRDNVLAGDDLLEITRVELISWDQRVPARDEIPKGG